MAHENTTTVTLYSLCTVRETQNADNAITFKLSDDRVCGVMQQQLHQCQQVTQYY